MRRPLSNDELASVVNSVAGTTDALALGLALGRVVGAARAVDRELLDRLAAMPPRDLHTSAGRAAVIAKVDAWAAEPE